MDESVFAMLFSSVFGTDQSFTIFVESYPNSKYIAFSNIWSVASDGNLNAIWYIEGIYSTRRVQHNNGPGTRRREEKQKQHEAQRVTMSGNPKSPSTVPRHPLRTPNPLSHNATRQKRKKTEENKRKYRVEVHRQWPR